MKYNPDTMELEGTVEIPDYEFIDYIPGFDDGKEPLATNEQ